MDEFYLSAFDNVNNSRYKFFLLYKNKRNFFIEFVQSLKQKSDIAELNRIMALMDVYDNNLPQSKFRHIIGGNKDRKDIYEFKSKHIRVYVIKKSPNFFLILGGYKNNQEKDIEKIFRHFNNLPNEITIK